MKIILFPILYMTLAVGSATHALAQTNLVPNPSFEDIVDCDLDFGQADKAIPWTIVELSIETPDLFHACSTNEFFEVPTPSCNPSPLYPRSGNGMVGLVNIAVNEKIYARLLDDLPFNTDIYVSYYTIPRARCGGPMDIICYTNTQCLAFSDINFQSLQVILESDTIIDNVETWTHMQTCYEANGSEKWVLLGDYKLTTETLQDCEYIEPMGNNYGYYYVDDVVVAPFDVVPDTIVICGNEEREVDASFFEVPLQWNDGWVGGERTFSEAGLYTILGDVGDCFLTDQTRVIKIDDEFPPLEQDICKNSTLNLRTPFPAIWENGDTSKTREVDRPGIYQATVLTPCGERIQEFIVEASECSIDYFVPNAFSPNFDGINDQMEFFFHSDHEFSGDLFIYDRWGNMLWNTTDLSADNSVRWDGTFNGQPLGADVYVWVFRYRSEQDQQIRVISGDFVLIR